MTEPVSLSLARQQVGLQVGDDEDTADRSRDALLTTYISAARQWVERYTGHILVQREVTEPHPAFGRFFDLRWQPFDPETVEIAYTDADGSAGTVVDLIANGQRVSPAYSTWWPTTRYGTGVSITYTAGYEAGEVPEPLVQAILLLVGHWFAVREAVNVGNIVTQVPYAVEALCDQFRAPGL